MEHFEGLEKVTKRSTHIYNNINKEVNRVLLLFVVFFLQTNAAYTHPTHSMGDQSSVLVHVPLALTTHRL